MKFKGQGKISICGFEYKKNIADSRRGGGSEHPPPPPVSAPGLYRSEVNSLIPGSTASNSPQSSITLDFVILYAKLLELTTRIVKKIIMHQS